MCECVSSNLVTYRSVSLFQDTSNVTHGQKSGNSRHFYQSVGEAQIHVHTFFFLHKQVEEGRDLNDVA